jgi:hypothetical protein
MIMYFPRILEARATIERQQAEEITEENRASFRYDQKKQLAHDHAYRPDRVGRGELVRSYEGARRCGVK